MSVVTYTATESLLPNHVEGSVYELPLRMVGADHTHTDRKVEQQALSGRRETLIWNSRSGLSVTVGSYMEVSIEFDWVTEFLDSVVGGEAFIFDRWGKVGSPRNPRLATLVGRYRVNRHGERPGDGNDLMRFSFSIEFT